MDSRWATSVKDGVLSSPDMTLSIHFMKRVTRVQTPGLLGEPHSPFPQLVIPCNTHFRPFLHTRGPPESLCVKVKDKTEIISHTRQHLHCCAPPPQKQRLYCTNVKIHMFVDYKSTHICYDVGISSLSKTLLLKNNSARFIAYCPLKMFCNRNNVIRTLSQCRQILSGQDHSPTNNIIVLVSWWCRCRPQ